MYKRQVYSYLKQLIDGNDVGVLLRVADEVVSVMYTVSFLVPAGYLTTVKKVSNGMKLALSLIRKYLPEGALSRIYLDEQPKDLSLIHIYQGRRASGGRRGKAPDRHEFRAHDLQHQAVHGRGLPGAH